LNRGAFSLLELLIVIVIMGIVYNLSVNSFDKKREDGVNITLETLKEYLQNLEYERDVKLLCFDGCRNCDILVDGIKTKSIDGFLDDSVRSYRYQYLFGVQEVMKDAYFNEDGIQEDVCFSYDIDKNGIGEQILVEFKNSVYDFSTYLSPIQKYSSMEDAIDAKQKLMEEVIR